MNHLVFLKAQTGELEKILSGMKNMIIRELDPAHLASQSVKTGDCLYFLRNEDDCILRVKATVVQILFFESSSDEDLSHLLKEAQPKLQLTEEEYNRWVGKRRILLVEFTSAHKIGLVRVAPEKISDRSDWIAFEEFSLITESKL